MTVESLATQRGPATEARALYSESEASRQQRLALSAQRRLEGHGAGSHERRPDKRSRRMIRQFKQQ